MIKAQEHFRAKATDNQPLQHALTDHTSAIQMKKGTEAPASSAATERAETSVSVATEHANVEFPFECAIAETASSSALRRVAGLSPSHASSSAAGRDPRSRLEPSQLLQNIGTHADPIINTYANLFHSPDSYLSNALVWAHANATHPHVAAWLHACSQWDSAVATKEHEHREKRRKLCKEHDIPLTRVVDTNKELETAMEYIRRQLTN